MSHNWIFDGSPNGWTMVSNALTNTHVGVIRPGGYFTSTEPIHYNSVHPVLYLNSDVKVVSGTGTIEAPYQLSR